LRVFRGVVSLVDSARFKATYEEYKLKAANESLRQNEAEDDEAVSSFRLRRQKVAMRKGLKRQKRLWSPFRRALPLQALKVASLLVRDPEMVLVCLAAAWGPVFKKKAIPTKEAQEHVERFSSQFAFGDVRPPIVYDFLRFLRVAGHSAPGVDG